MPDIKQHKIYYIMMRNRLNYILISMLFCIFFIAGVMEIRSFYTGIQQSKIQLNTEITHLLKQAAEENGKIKNKNTPKIGDYNNRPKLFGSSETRTFCNADTTFTYQHKITDIDTELDQSNQHFLLLTNQLYSQDIQILFDSLLRNKNIKVQTAIGITSTGYPKRNMPWSKDTLRMNIHERTHYVMEADFAQIHYTAYLEYSFGTLWKRIENKNTLYLWGIITLIAVGSLAYIYFLKKKDKPKEISENETIPSSQKAVPIISKEETKETTLPFQMKEEYIIVGDKKRKLAPQSKQILEIFLNAENYRIEKLKLKELWPTKASDSTSNMTSAVKRINDTFKKVGCKSEIITDPESRDFYLLK